MVTMTFELQETWRRDANPKQMGEFLHWTSPSLEKPRHAAHVYESLGKWEWYAFPPMGHQADAQGKEPTEEAAKKAARTALYVMATGWPPRA